MLQDEKFIKGGPLSWKLFFGLKLILGLLVSGFFYFETSIEAFWRFSFLVFSVVVFLLVNLFYSNVEKRKKWLFHLLILDFLVSAAYGYIFIGGHFPNQLFVGITALAILMFLNNFRMLILTCVFLLALYLVTMGSVDWYLYKQFDSMSYFITCSFIIFAGIVSSLIHFYQKARKDTLKLYEQLMESHERLQEYAIKAEEWAASRERVRIARDIHDTVGHKLTSLIVQMQAARKLSQVDAKRSGSVYLECEDLVRSALQEVRLTVRTIRDEPVQPMFLHESLEKLSEEFTKFTQVVTRFEVEGSTVPLPGELQLAAYRIVQESLTNAKKHADAEHARIRIVYSESGLSLHITNDGSVPDEVKPGFGLLNLQERVKEWNGRVSFGKVDRMQFAVQADIPYPNTETEVPLLENSGS
ncbi:sensor histidine kinase [Paenibacillus radicis (ex Gao et al. 2016)]|uniref:histidine kinase n=1 Tax=Paenibacillus radicis (ex Gao et al. 2016) TaxID=1737354 RepID=A0A917GNQ2_9BACL|nr:sensor histidine kinase [Paenibacillus radicis (ex Gao et al. 2016)]GGG52846.1 sensor histidine kinase YfiJ [Paenibacillus radicis (ex Gao et al. 2016)]